MTHTIPNTARPAGRSQYRALCGALVEGYQHARGTPECPDCRRIGADDEASLLALRQATAEDFGGPPVKPIIGNPLKDYRPRKRA